jgi:phosphomannomutase
VGGRGALVKAYDIRGVAPDQLDPPAAHAAGAAFAAIAEASTIIVGRDMRTTSPALAAAFADGVLSRGVDVLDIGLASTDMLYFASGELDLPGAVITASHNPARYNGIKFCRAGAVPVGPDTGLGAIRVLLDADPPQHAARPGRHEHAPDGTPCTATPSGCATWST